MIPADLSSLPSCMLSGQLLVLLPVCNRYFFCILLQPCYGTMPISPSSDKNSIVYGLQPLDGNASNSHFFFFFLSFLLTFNNSFHIETEASLVSAPQSCFCSCGLSASLLHQFFLHCYQLLLLWIALLFFHPPTPMFCFCFLL